MLIFATEKCKSRFTHPIKYSISRFTYFADRCKLVLTHRKNKYWNYGQTVRTHVRSLCHPLEHFDRYLQYGYYPFYFESKQAYHVLQR